MPTGRQFSGSVHIPGVGDLVIGGSSSEMSLLKTVELLKQNNLRTGNAHAWSTINPTIKPRFLPSAVYFEGRVFVASRDEAAVEMLLFHSGQPAQWTIIYEFENASSIESMCIFNRILLSTGKK